MFDKNAMLIDMEKSVRTFFRDFVDKPEWLSGWGHNYFCEEDGGRLIFAQNSPHTHICPVCGHVYSGEKFDRAWIYLNRVMAVQEAEKSAYLYRATGDADFAGFVVRLIDYFAKNYQKFALHAKDFLGQPPPEDVGGAGRITPQGLNEAMVLAKLLRAMDILGDALPAATRENAEIQLFAPAIEQVLSPQLNAVHNIKCWINSAIAMAGIYFDNPKWRDLAFCGEYNLARQLREGVTADNFWYEGSIHYNFFTLEAILALLDFCKKYGHDFGAGREIPRAMLYAAYDYAFDSGVLPNPNDGWPDLGLKTYLPLYFTGAAVYDDPGIEAMAAAILAQPQPRTPLPLWDYYHFQNYPLEALLNLPQTRVNPPQPQSAQYPASNFAMLRSEGINLFVKYGHNGPSHAHPDKMTFELCWDRAMITRDLSNAGYGARISNEWHRMSISHNTIVVDGENQTDTGMGQICAFGENYITARANAYPHIIFDRNIGINNGIFDNFIAKSTDDKKHIFDYALHIDGKISHSGDETPAELRFDQNGYQHIKNIRAIKNCQKFVINKKFTITIEGDGEIFLCETFDNPVTTYRDTLIIRKRGNSAEFNLTIKENEKCM